MRSTISLAGHIVALFTQHTGHLSARDMQDIDAIGGFGGAPHFIHRITLVGRRHGIETGRHPGLDQSRCGNDAHKWPLV